MIDSNVLIDVFQGGTQWSAWSLDRMAEARTAGAIAISAIVIGELASRERQDDLRAAFDDLGLAVHDFEARAAYRAGMAQKAYREAGGTRERLLGDFLVGAHAETAGAKLLTRDARRYRQYFSDLILITPENDA